jgi:hypothetical protein
VATILYSPSQLPFPNPVPVLSHTATRHPALPLCRVHMYSDPHTHTTPQWIAAYEDLEKYVRANEPESCLTYYFGTPEEYGYAQHTPDHPLLPFHGLLGTFCPVSL